MGCIFRVRADTSAPSKKSLSKQEEEDLDYYSKSYSHYSIHESMLKDTVRTESIPGLYPEQRRPLQGQGCSLWTVGCGTSILSLFAAKAGAKKVIGVDASHVAEKAREIVNFNGFEKCDHHCQGQDGRGHLASGKGGHHHLRVDGVLSPL